MENSRNGRMIYWFFIVITQIPLPNNNTIYANQGLKHPNIDRRRNFRQIQRPCVRQEHSNQINNCCSYKKIKKNKKITKPYLYFFV